MLECADDGGTCVGEGEKCADEVEKCADDGVKCVEEGKACGGEDVRRDGWVVTVVERDGVRRLLFDPWRSNQTPKLNPKSTPRSISNPKIHRKP